MDTRILIVDDEKIIRDVLTRMLNSHGFQTNTADNGKIALQTIQQNKYNLILLDILMPEMNGIQFLQKISKLKKTPKVIVISACNDMALMEQCKNLGASAYLKKPFDDIHEVLAAVKQVLGV